MEQHARSAVSTSTKMGWGLPIALLVHQTPPLLLAAPQKSPVNVTLGTLEKMEQHAHSAV